MKFIKIILLGLIITTQAVAQKPLPSLLVSLKKAERDTNRVLSLNALANYYRNINPDSAVLFARQGVSLSGELNYPYGLAILNLFLGDMDMRQGKVAEAKSDFEASQGAFEKLKNEKGIAAVNNGFGVLAARQSDYKEATPHFLKALSIYTKLKDINGMVQSYIKLGMVNSQIGNLDKARDYYVKGIKLSKKLPVSNATGTLLSDIAIVYAKKNDFRGALVYLNEGLKKITDPHLADVRVSLLINAGGAYENLGNIKAAFQYENEALLIVRKMHLRDLEGNTLVTLASLLQKTKPDTSAVLLHQAMTIAKEINQSYLMLDVYLGMVDLLKQQGNYKEAELTLEKRNDLQDSLFTLQKAKDIAGLQSSYELANSALREQQLKLNNQQIKYNRNIILAVAIGVFILFIIVLFFYQRTRRLNTELVKRKNILSQQKEVLDQQNNFKDKIFSIIGHDLRSPIATIVNLMEVAEENDLSVEEFQDLVPQLKEQSNAILDILDKLLVWGRSQLKGTRYNRSVFNARELITKNMVLYKNAALQKTISLTDYSPNELLIYADITQVDFIIRNLLANAIKYTHEGGEIEIAAVLNEPIGFNAIVIKDNGIGIAKESQQLIFERENLSIEGTAKELG
ncbi:tetratricopeptide repeat-containing sensor histidine kinase, partial [Mucilaginibacter sp.]